MTATRILPPSRLPDLKSADPKVGMWVAVYLQPLITQIFDQFSALIVGTTLTPAQMTANQNDYTPTGLISAAFLRLSTDASRNITGLGTGIANRELKVFNVGSFDVVLKNADAASIAANRFAFGADITLNPDEGVTLWYDGTSAVWRSSGRHT